jgi:hypothetical protein
MNRYRVRNGFGVGLTMAFLWLAYAPGMAADISLVALYKRQVFVQTNAGPAFPRCSPFMFDAIVELAGSNSVAAAAVAAPGGAQTALTVSEEREFLPRRWFSWTCGSFPTQEALETTWPNGKYSFFIFGISNRFTAPALSLAGDTYPTNAPHIQNFVEAQAVDPATDFSLRWDAFPEGTTNDVVFVSVRSVAEQVAVFSTAFLKREGGLDGTATAVTIPAGILAAGQDYDVYVRFDKVLERNEVMPGVAGLASYASGTHFILKTSPAPAGS